MCLNMGVFFTTQGDDPPASCKFQKPVLVRISRPRTAPTPYRRGVT
jgi:hypothetical protein